MASYVVFLIFVHLLIGPLICTSIIYIYGKILLYRQILEISHFRIAHKRLTQLSQYLAQQSQQIRNDLNRITTKRRKIKKYLSWKRQRDQITDMWAYMYTYVCGYTCLIFINHMSKPLLRCKLMENNSKVISGWNMHTHIYLLWLFASIYVYLCVSMTRPHYKYPATDHNSTI